MTKGQACFNEILNRGVFLRFPGNRRVLFGVLAIGQFAGMVLMTERPARAYVDPGSGLFALQMLSASVVGGLYFVRRKVRNLVGDKPDRMLRAEEPATPGKSADQGLTAARSPSSDT